MSNNKVKRDQGEAIALRFLQQSRQLSQNDIVGKTGLTPSAVSRIIDRLERKGIVFRSESNGTPAAVGRPAKTVCLNPESRFIISAYVSLHTIHFARINLGLECDILLDIPKPQHLDSKELLKILLSHFKKFTSPSRIGSPDRFLGFTVQTSGLTNGDTGCIWDSQTVSVKNGPYNLADNLENKLGYPVVLESESNAALSGEMLCGVGHGVNNAVYVYYDADGMVLSFYFNGRLYHGGKNGYAGQLSGYSFEEYEKGECQTVNAYWLPPVSLSNIELQTLQSIGLPNTITKFGELFSHNIHDNQPIKQIIEKRLSMLGTGLSNICSLLCPEKIILGGILTELDDTQIEIIKTHFHQSANTPHITCPAEASEIITGSLPMLKAVFIGGATRLFPNASIQAQGA
jgi:predicted NBD/HSP70 family sugar kinase